MEDVIKQALLVGKIQSLWKTEKVSYDGVKSEYTEEKRLIEVTITRGLIKFAGPTGCEEYRISRILESAGNDFSTDFCICGGTVNRWPSCVVKWGDVIQFLADNGYRRKVTLAAKIKKVGKVVTLTALGTDDKEFRITGSSIFEVFFQLNKGAGKTWPLVDVKILHF